jgi:hypothetical protein
MGEIGGNSCCFARNCAHRLVVLALGVSILALLLLTVPVYSLLRSLTRPSGTTAAGVPIEEPGPVEIEGLAASRPLAAGGWRRR